MAHLPLCHLPLSQRVNCDHQRWSDPDLMHTEPMRWWRVTEYFNSNIKSCFASSDSQRSWSARKSGYFGFLLRSLAADNSGCLNAFGDPRPWDIREATEIMFVCFPTFYLMWRGNRLRSQTRLVDWAVFRGGLPACSLIFLIHTPVNLACVYCDLPNHCQSLIFHRFQIPQHEKILVFQQSFSIFVRIS